MYNLEYVNEVTEVVAETVIFEACRANKSRNTKTVNFLGVTYTVHFNMLASGDYESVVCFMGVRVATATVDEYDR